MTAPVLPVFSAHQAVETTRLIEAVGVSKKYCRNFRKSLSYAVRDILRGLFPGKDRSILRPDEFWAVRDVSFTLSRGDSLGLIGQNGAGKSTLLKILTGQRALTTGKVIMRGRVVALTQLGLGFDPVMSGRENAYVNAAVFGVPRAKLNLIIEDIIDFAGIREFIDSAVQTYSSGMKARLGFSVATHLNPDILIVDEVLAVGDLAFRRKCVEHIQGFLRRGGSMLLVAHDPYLIQTICNRCLVMEKGRLIFDGGSVEGVNLHFELGHAGRLEAAGGSTLPGSTPRKDTGDGQTDERNWLTRSGDMKGPAVFPQPTASLRPILTDEHPVVVDRFEVLPESEPLLTTGGSAIVTIFCRSRITVVAGWGFMIYTADLLTCIFSCSIGLDGRSVAIQPGENRFRCRIPVLPLCPGNYVIRGGVADLNTSMAMALLGFQDSPNFFAVKGARVDRTGNWHALLNDLVSVPVEWSDQSGRYGVAPP
jgi:ABC-type polysaccharide/polyol phosphate transport system ATPase subunit